MGVTVTTPAAEDPVTLTEVKLHARIDISDDDAALQAMIQAATEYVQAVSGRQMVAATMAETFDRFCPVLPLARTPVTSIVSVTYLDENGDSQVVSSSIYKAILDRPIACVLRADGQSWPNTHPDPNAVTVNYVAGYATASAVPSSLRMLVKMIVADLYAHREANLESRVQENMTLRNLLWSQRVARIR